jgi:cytochrome c biogenesis protein CcmG, thiol:disulfide interchange protein DsbE
LTLKALRFLVPLAVFAALVAFLYAGLSLNPREVPSPLIGKPAPAFSAPRLDDASKLIKREDFAGKPWVLNVWASWCAPCREEHPLIVEFAKTAGVPIVGLNYKDETGAARQWLSRLGDPYVVTLHDPAGRIGLDFGVYGVPETFVIDAGGVIRFKHTGPLSRAILQDKIAPLLKGLQKS